MIYYVMSGMDIHGSKKYLAYSIDDDKYYWTDTSMEAAVTRFADPTSVVGFSLTRTEFTRIINTGTELLPPELLYNMNVSSISVEQVIYFEFVQALDFSVAMNNYHAKKVLFDAKQKELSSI